MLYVPRVPHRSNPTSSRGHFFIRIITRWLSNKTLDSEAGTPEAMEYLVSIYHLSTGVLRTPYLGSNRILPRTSRITFCKDSHVQQRILTKDLWRRGSADNTSPDRHDRV